MSFTRFIVVSLSHIPSDPRVKRQAVALLQPGTEVVLLGIEGSRFPAPGPASYEGMAYHTLSRPDWPLGRKLIDAAALLAARLPLGLERDLAIARRMPGAAAAEAALLSLLERFDRRERTMVIANDWNTIPAALSAHRRFAVPFHLDVHELSYAEHQERLDWRLLFPPLIKSIEAVGLATAHSSSCVSPGIARLMAQTYRLSVSPTVILNVPDGPPLPPRQPGSTINVLYHGLFNPNRGLERLIRSTATWLPHLRLVLRGRAPAPAYECSLRELIATLRVGDRVEVEPMVPQAKVITTANAADIGIFLPSLASPQNRFALPNKLFEYLHAGLLVVIPAATDMARVTAPYDCCLTLNEDDQTPEGIAAALNSIDSAELWTRKQRAHEAAQLFNWSREKSRFLAQFAASRGAEDVTP
jgi:glycogen synthase